MTKREEKDARRSRAIAGSRNRRVFSWVLVVLALALVGYLVFLSNRPRQSVDSEVLALGAEVYAESCASCHGDQGQGHALVELAPALNDSEHAWHHPDGQIQELIITGGVQMPAFSDQLAGDEIFAVIRYIQAWWTAEQLAAQQNASQTYPLH